MFLAGGHETSMKRFVIFGALFPPLALVIFNAPDVIMHHDFKLLDSSSFQMAYAIAVIPALLLAWVDWALSANRLRVVGTAVTAAIAAVLIVLFMSGGSDELWPVLMVGLVGGVPAAVCSWLSDTMRSVNA
jgi:hypothetical protein